MSAAGNFGPEFGREFDRVSSAGVSAPVVFGRKFGRDSFLFSPRQRVEFGKKGRG